MTSVTYPSTLSYNSSTQSFSTTPGPAYTYLFDGMHRYNGLIDQNNNVLASGVQYGPSNELLSINYSGMTETRQFNNLVQLTQLTNGVANRTFNYPVGTNNGKMGSQYNAITGETITYQYDSLSRLISAAGNGWSQTFGYDAFGSLTSIIGNNAPALSVAVNSVTNQIVGQGYDANGNQLTTAAFSGNSLTYDPENRLIHAPGVQYAYDSQNKRIWKATLDLNNTYITGQQAFFYGANGQLMGTYTLSTSTLGPAGQPYVLTDPSATPQVYFGSKRMDEIQDDQGSTIKSGSNGFFPYGEDRGTPQVGESFASYPTDTSLGLNYADQRYYSSQFGRFMMPDPSGQSISLNNPQSWNRYPYVLGDPVNATDPSGLTTCDPWYSCYDSVTVNGDTGQAFWSDSFNYNACFACSYDATPPSNYSGCPDGQILDVTGCDVPLTPTAQLFFNYLGQALTMQVQEAFHIGISTYVASGIGALCGAVASLASESATSFFEGTTLSSAATDKMATYVENGDVFHTFSMEDAGTIDYGTVSKDIGGDGRPYTRLDIPGVITTPSGSVYSGQYEFIKNADNEITHWYFNAFDGKIPPNATRASYGYYLDGVFFWMEPRP